VPRRRKPHHHEIRYLPIDPAVPFEQWRALYCRLSDDDERSVSIEHQIERGKTHAAAHNLTVVAIYVDWRTGLDPDRIALTRMIEDGHTGKHPGVIFYDHYRFHRGVMGAYPVVKLHSELPEYTFEATVGGYDVGQIGIWAGISGMELETTRRRSMEQRRTRAERGQWMAGMKPYWLERDPDSLAATIEPERAAAFLHALELYTEPNGSALAVCAWLTEHAPPTLRRGAPQTWTSQRFRNLLRNPALWGDLPYGRGLDVKERRDGRQVIVKRKQDNPAAVAFTVPPLIHKNELDRVQCRVRGGCSMDRYPSGTELNDLISRRDGKLGGRPYDIHSPLGTIKVLCACGWKVRWQVRRLTTRAGIERSYAYVSCAAQYANGRTTLSHTPCRMPSMPLDASTQRPQGGGMKSKTGAVWPRVREKLIAALSDPYQLAEEQRQMVLAEQGMTTRSLADEAERLETLDAELLGLDEREDQLYDDYRKKIVSKPVYERQTTRIASARREAEEFKRQILAQKLAADDAEEAATALLVALSELGALLDDLTPVTDDQWSRILPDLIDSISLDVSGEPTIHWRRPR
jgi:DNA invertase Pin-like site-specific DNA recombinase